jgi:hypothetical protein
VECFFLPATQDASQRGRDTLGDLVLDGEDIFELAVVALRPALIAVLDVDQLHVDPEAIAGLAHAALENRGDTQAPSHGADVHSRPTELERRAAGGDAEPIDVGQRVDQLLGEAVTEIVLVAGRAQVGKRQDRDRLCRLGLA